MNIVGGGASKSITSGNYTGDGSTNRGIPHGLGTTPKIVFIWQPGGMGEILYKGGLIAAITGSNTCNIATGITDFDATNFYVGKAGAESGNGNLQPYQWIALP